MNLYIGTAMSVFPEIYQVTFVCSIDRVVKTKYMVMSRDQQVGQNHDMKIDNKSFETDE